MSSKNLTLVANTNGVVETKSLVSDGGSPVKIKAQPHVKYLLVDENGQIAPENITLTRAGDDLEVTLEGDSGPSMVIEGYYAQPESDDPVGLYGIAEDGQLYAYVPTYGTSSIASLADGGTTLVALGGDRVAWFARSADDRLIGVDEAVVADRRRADNRVAVIDRDGVAGPAGADEHGRRIVGRLAGVNQSLRRSRVVVQPRRRDFFLLVDGRRSRERVFVPVGGQRDRAHCGSDATEQEERQRSEPGVRFAAFEVRRTEAERITVTYPDGQQTTTTVDDDGNWTAPPPDEPLADGPGGIIVTETDPAGNETSVQIPLNIDTQAPDAPQIGSVIDNVEPVVGELASGQSTNDPQPVLSGTSEPGSTTTTAN